MKTKFKILILTVLLAGIFTPELANAQTSPDPSVNSATVAIAPTAVGETANSISFQFMNVSPIGTLGLFPPTTLTIQLSDMTVLGNFNPANVTGPGSAFFTWSYNQGLNMITGTLNSAVAPFAGGLVNITGFVIVDSSNVQSPQAGFNVNVNATGSNNQSTTNDFTSSYTYTTGVVLPIELLGFSAEWKDKDGYLNWATSSEVNSSKFIIERSMDGISFEKIGTVNAAGNSNTEKRYSFTDKFVYNDVYDNVYYRLQLVDMDGSIRLSKVQKLEKEFVDKDYTVYPNPTTGKIRFNNLDEIVNIVLYNSVGQRLERRVVNDPSILEYDFTGLAVGVYQLVLVDENYDRFSFKLEIIN